MPGMFRPGVMGCEIFSAFGVIKKFNHRLQIELIRCLSGNCNMLTDFKGLIL